jgi:hypothetical protein
MLDNKYFISDEELQVMVLLCMKVDVSVFGLVELRWNCRPLSELESDLSITHVGEVGGLEASSNNGEDTSWEQTAEKSEIYEL